MSNSELMVKQQDTYEHTNRSSSSTPAYHNLWLERMCMHYTSYTVSIVKKSTLTASHQQRGKEKRDLDMYMYACNKTGGT